MNRLNRGLVKIGKMAVVASILISISILSTGCATMSLPMSSDRMNSSSPPPSTSVTDASDEPQDRSTTSTVPYPSGGSHPDTPPANHPKEQSQSDQNSHSRMKHGMMMGCMGMMGAMMGGMML